MDKTQLCSMPATELAAAIRSRHVSPVEGALAAAQQAEAAVLRGEELGYYMAFPSRSKT